MTPPLFLVPGDRLAASDAIRVDGFEGRHAATVRRIAVGERVLLSDGCGGLALCEVSVARKDLLDCTVLRRERVARPEPRIVVVQALAKGADEAVETMTEVGVDEIVPWQAARSVVRWRGERVAKGLDRWRATAREASKQSRRAWLPAVAEPAMSTADVVEWIGAVDRAYLLDDNGGGPGEVRLPGYGRVLLVVGPEGGLVRAELDAMTGAGATGLRLGPTVLRSATAGTVGAAVLLARTSRWS